MNCIDEDESNAWIDLLEFDTLRTTIGVGSWHLKLDCKFSHKKAPTTKVIGASIFWYANAY
ncbi:MAG TPA: hypothetical protein DCY51_10225 [Bacteroidetes bacterium]|nr:hypothetical protein [Bacteroidota bacterium]